MNASRSAAVTALTAAQSNQFPQSSRGRIPPNCFIGLPFQRCPGRRTAGSSSFSATFRLLNCVTFSLMTVTLNGCDHDVQNDFEVIGLIVGDVVFQDGNLSMPHRDFKGPDQ